MTTVCPSANGDVPTTSLWMKDVGSLPNYWSSSGDDNLDLYGPGYVQKMMQRFALLACQANYEQKPKLPKERRAHSYDEQLEAKRSNNFTSPHRSENLIDDWSSTPGSVLDLKRKFERFSSATKQPSPQSQQRLPNGTPGARGRPVHCAITSSPPKSPGPTRNQPPPSSDSAELRITRPWLYYKSGVDFLQDRWPIVSTCTDDASDDQVPLHRMTHRSLPLVSAGSYDSFDSWASGPSTPASVSQLKRKFERLSTSADSMERTGDGTHRSVPVELKVTDASEVFDEASFDLTKSNDTVTSGLNRPRRKSSDSEHVQLEDERTMTTAAMTNGADRGLVEMNRLLEKFRQSRQGKNVANGDGPKGALHSSPDDLDSAATRHPGLRPSPRPSLSTRARLIRQEEVTQHLSEIESLRKVGCVVASYVTEPAGHFLPAAGCLSDSGSECSSYDAQECQRRYQFDNAYVIPSKSSLYITASSKIGLKNNAVVFSEEPPVAYVYLEETEAALFGQWQAGADMTMESYFHIKEQMREERSRSMENGVH